MAAVARAAVAAAMVAAAAAAAAAAVARSKNNSNSSRRPKKKSRSLKAGPRQWPKCSLDLNCNWTPKRSCPRNSGCTDMRW